MEKLNIMYTVDVIWDFHIVVANIHWSLVTVFNIKKWVPTQEIIIVMSCQLQKLGVKE